jgi:hypothetical protein
MGETGTNREAVVSDPVSRIVANANQLQQVACAARVATRRFACGVTRAEVGGPVSAR